MSYSVQLIFWIPEGFSNYYFGPSLNGIYYYEQLPMLEYTDNVFLVPGPLRGTERKDLHLQRLKDKTAAYTLRNHSQPIWKTVSD